MSVTEIKKKKLFRMSLILMRILLAFQMTANMVA